MSLIHRPSIGIPVDITVISLLSHKLRTRPPCPHFSNTRNTAVVSVTTFRFEFHQEMNMENTSSPIHLISIHWIVNYHVFGAMLESYHKLQWKPITIFELKTHCGWFRCALTAVKATDNVVPWVTSTSDWRQVCQPVVDILNTKSDNSHNRR